MTITPHCVLICTWYDLCKMVLVYDKAHDAFMGHSCLHTRYYEFQTYRTLHHQNITKASALLISLPNCSIPISRQNVIAYHTLKYDMQCQSPPYFNIVPSPLYTSAGFGGSPSSDCTYLYVNKLPPSISLFSKFEKFNT